MDKKKATDLNKKTIRISEAAAMLGVNPITLRRWELKGYLTPLRMGPRMDRRYLMDDIEKLLEKKKSK